VFAHVGSTEVGECDSPPLSLSLLCGRLRPLLAEIAVSCAYLTMSRSYKTPASL
jgi:hypothetical protein